MVNLIIPKEIPNFIANEEQMASSGKFHPKHNPHTGEVLTQVTRSGEHEVNMAFEAAERAFESWSSKSPIERGEILYKICDQLVQENEEMGQIVATETGKSTKDGIGETFGAIALGRFYAAEGQRLFGRTTTHSDPNKQVLHFRVPCGIAGLIIAANTPIANVAWKVFPALIGGNTIVLKAAEDTPATAWKFAHIAAKAGLPPGVLNVIQGIGSEAGAPIVNHPKLNVLSFTGSSKTGKFISKITGENLVKTSMELGGKNALVVCADADLNNAVEWSSLSSFSNAGQRCAASSRIIVEESIYEEFKTAFVKKASELKLGNKETDDLGPVVNQRQADNIMKAIKEAEKEGAKILVGGTRANEDNLANGYYIKPTILENVDPKSAIARTELFGPVTILFKVGSYKEALALTNDCDYGLTACIHTNDMNKAMHFALKSKSGTAITNAGTYGSQPHMPFGGLGNSGNGSREPGPEGIEVYTELKTVVYSINPDRL
jgi:aldehyde dehydrogenase (NAD+)